MIFNECNFFIQEDLQYFLVWSLKKIASLNCVVLLKPAGEGNGTPLQYSCLENPMDGGAWWAAVHGVTKSRARLSDFTFTFHFHALEKEMATHSSVLAWRIPGTGEPSGLPSIGSHRIRHDWRDLAAAAAVYIQIEISNIRLFLKSEAVSSSFWIPTTCFTYLTQSSTQCMLNE